MNFVEEIRWRGMLHDMMPGTEELLSKEKTSAYIGFDPSSDSLHVGSLAQIMTLIHLIKAGHKAVVLLGGATGMVGDPSGKSQERNLISDEVLQNNLEGIKSQLAKCLEPYSAEEKVLFVNNYDWFKNFSFLEFIRDVGKHITVNYMMAKDSVKKRLEGESGMSFTEFSYQLVQGYDFYHLWKEFGCKIQMGGSDQWGNIVTGTEFIRRKAGGEAFALTTQLVKKSDGSKFGKTESGNIWLDKTKTSPYRFYQFWLNASDEDAKSWIRTFTLLPKVEIEKLEEEHLQAPHLRILQKALAADVTIRIHGADDYNSALEASQILFGNSTEDALQKLDENTLLDVFDGVPQFKISKSKLDNGINLIELLAEDTSVFPSKGEARKMLQGGGVGINKQKVVDMNLPVNSSMLIANKYLIIQKGKKNFYLIIAEN